MTSEPSNTPVHLWKKAGAVLAVVALAMTFKWLYPSETAFETIVFSGNTMATTYHIKVVRRVSERADNSALAHEIEARLESENRQMSTYFRGGDIYRVNEAPANTPVKVTNEVIHVLQRAVEISRMTGGAFDVTVGPLIRVWGFHDKVRRDKPPADAEIDAAKAKVGFEKLVLDAQAGTVTKKVEGLDVDLSAIAKGYAVDQVALLLEKRGEHNYMVEVGGEIRCRGHNEQSQPWKIGIERPADGQDVQRQVLKIVHLNRTALATSGDYRSFYMMDGNRVSHTIDPALGRPILHHLASVSVLTSDCMTADALATAFTVLGASAGIKLADKHHIAAYFIERKGNSFVERSSEAFRMKFDSAKE